MFVQTAFRKTKRSETLEQTAVEKIRMQLDKFVTKPIGLRVWFECVGTQHIVHCTVTAGDRLTVHAREVSENFNDAIDGVVAKISRQLSRRKGLRLTKRLHDPAAQNLAALSNEPDLEVCPMDWDDMN